MAIGVWTARGSCFVGRGVKGDSQPLTYLADALPAGKGLLADPQSMEGAGRWVMPSEKSGVLEPVVPEHMTPEPACPEWLSCVQPSQWEVSTVGDPGSPSSRDASRGGLLQME